MPTLNTNTFAGNNVSGRTHGLLCILAMAVLAIHGHFKSTQHTSALYTIADAKTYMCNLKFHMTYTQDAAFLIDH